MGPFGAKNQGLPDGTREPRPGTGEPNQDDDEYDDGGDDGGDDGDVDDDDDVAVETEASWSPIGTVAHPLLLRDISVGSRKRAKA